MCPGARSDNFAAGRGRRGRWENLRPGAEKRFHGAGFANIVGQLGRDVPAVTVHTANNGVRDFGLNRFVVGDAVSDLAKFVEPVMDERARRARWEDSFEVRLPDQPVVAELVRSTQKPNINSAITLPGGAAGPPAYRRAAAMSR